MNARYCRVSDGTGWYTKHRDENFVAAQMAERLESVGIEKLSDFQFYWLGPKEPLTEEIRERLIALALSKLKSK